MDILPQPNRRATPRRRGQARGTRTGKPARVRVAGEVISATELYSLAALKLRTGLGTAALRAARRAGLTTIKVGARTYGYGGDFIAWAKAQAATPALPEADDARRAG